MKYSNKQIDKAGYVIAAEPTDVLAYAEAMTLVDDWRKMHLPVLERLVLEVSKVLSANGVVPAFSSQRLKRMVSIKEKLQRKSNMGLGRVQDIGGARFVFDDVGQLFAAREALASTSLESFTQDHDIYDYVQSPKDSGYRSIHFVYKYHSEDEDLDGMRVELQIRTRLQHDWATAVETAELISQSSLKASLGDKDWLDFFKLVSAVFARMEQLPVNEYFRKYTEKDYCEEYARYESQHKFIDQLKALVGVVRLTEEHSFVGGYAVVLIEHETKTVTMRHFNSDQQEKANDLYAQTENQINPSKAAVVMVAVSDAQELREAYPSYFLNANEFITALAEFQSRCRLQGFIN